MKKYFLAVFLCGYGWLLYGQTIVQLEYFIDTDAGMGNNTLVPVTATPDGAFEFTVNLAGVSPGRHALYTRVKNSNGLWSHTTKRGIEVYVSDAISNLTQLEYFIDTDAGVGNNTIVPFTPTPNGDLSFQVNLSAVLPGRHFLYTRVKDNSGKWSHTTRRGIEVYESLAGSKVIAVEYFFNSDPGVGAASYVTFTTPAADGSFSLTIPQNQVTAGLDTLYLRVQDEVNKKWSHTQYIDKNFQVVTCTTPGQPAVIANNSKCAGGSASYSIPAIAGATSYVWEVPAGWSITTGQGTVAVTLQTPAVLSTTDYTISVAATNACGTGLPRTFTVTVNPLPPTPTITRSGNQLMSSATSGNQWMRDGIPIIGATEQIYLATISGNYTVQVTLSGCSSSVSEATNVVITSINDPVLQAGVHIYPNPFPDNVMIQNRGLNRITARVYDMIGQELFSKENITGSSLLSLSRLSPGIYLIRITDQQTKKSFTKMLMKQ